MGNITEAEEQKALVQWLQAKRIFHFAVVNENNTYKQDRKYAMIAEVKAKKMGKVKGVSDMVVILPHVVLFIEMKRRAKILKTGQKSLAGIKVSKEQYDFLSFVNNTNVCEGMICYGAKEAIEFIERNMLK